MKPVRVGIIGTKFIANVHANAFGHVSEGEVKLEAVVSGNRANAEAFARRFRIPKVYSTYAELLGDKEIDMVDICTPNNLHRDMVISAAEAGKHVICEKPLTGGFGECLTVDQVGNRITKEAFLNEARENAVRCKDAVKRSGVIFGYAENYIYAPPYRKMLRLLAKANGTVLDIRADESHSGSHAEYAKEWRLAGGGSLTRMGSHPIAAVLHMKYEEGRRKFGKPIRPRFVNCEIGYNTKTPAFQQEKEKWLKHGWVDVEDWAVAIITFDDNTRATVFASDCSLGGCKNLLQVFSSNGVLYANIEPNNALQIYAPRPGIWGDEFIAEKLETNGGWSFASSDDESTRGYVGELKDFVKCAIDGREPESGMDLAFDTVNVIYSGYVSAEQGRRVEL